MQINTAAVALLKQFFVARDGLSTINGILSPSTNESASLGEPHRRFDVIYARAIVTDSVGVGVLGSDSSTINSTDMVDGFHATFLPSPGALLALDEFGVFPTSVYDSALLTDGSRELTGNLTVSAGVTIDGIDISGHAADGSAHHLNGFSQDDHTQYVHLSTSRTITAVHTISPATETAPLILGANAQGQTVIGLKADQLNQQVTAGSGLTGGGYLTAGITLTVGAGNGISVADDTVAVDQTYGFTWTGAHTFQNSMTARNIVPELTDTYDLGSSLKMWRQSFISQINAVMFAQQTATLLGGWLIVGKGEGVLAADVTASTTVFNFGQAMTVGHFILIRAHDTAGAIKAEYIQVGTLVSGTTYNVTRDLAGAHGTDPAWAMGTPYLILGTTGDGRIELNAYDTPRISIVEQGATYNVQTERLRLGDLNGWGPFVTQAFGWAVGDYTGNEYAYYAPSTGLVIRGEVKADNGYLGALSVDGALSLGTDGGIYQGTGTFASPTTGLKIYNSSGVGKISGYASGVEQWYANTDGKLYAGAGAVILDVNGIGILSSSSITGSKNVLTFPDTVNSSLSSLSMYCITNVTAGRKAQAFLTVGDKFTGTGGGGEYEETEIRLASGLKPGSEYTSTVTLLANEQSSAYELSSSNAAALTLEYRGSGATYWPSHSAATLSAMYIYFDASTYHGGGFAKFSGAGLSIGGTSLTQANTIDEGYALIEHGIVIGSDSPAVVTGVDKTLTFGELSADPTAPPATFMREFYRDGALWAKDDHESPHNLFVDEVSTMCSTLYYTSSVYDLYLTWVTFRDATSDFVEWAVSSPKGWDGRTVYLDLYWGTSLTSGNVVWNFIFKPWTGNSKDYQGFTSSSQTIAVSSTSWNMKKTTFSFTWPTGKDMMLIKMTRLGSDGSDTASGSVYGAGMRVRIWN